MCHQLGSYLRGGIPQRTDTQVDRLVEVAGHVPDDLRLLRRQAGLETVADLDPHVVRQDPDGADEQHHGKGGDRGLQVKQATRSEPFVHNWQFRINPMQAGYVEHPRHRLALQSRATVPDKNFPADDTTSVWPQNGQKSRKGGNSRGLTDRGPGFRLGGRVFREHAGAACKHESRRWRYGGLAHAPACSRTGIRCGPKGLPNFP